MERTMRGQTDIPVLSDLLNIFVAQGGSEGYAFNVALWFLPCLFVTQIVFYVADRYIKNPYILAVAIAALSVGGYVYNLFVPFRLPWCVDSMAMVLPFYAAGYFLARRRCKGAIPVLSGIKTAVVAVALMAVLLVCAYANGRVDMDTGIYGNYFLFYCAAFAGILFFYLLCNFYSPRWIRCLGTGSLVIMCVHEPPKRVVIQLTSLAAGMPSDVLCATIFFVLLDAAAILFLCMVFYFVINRFSPLELAGQKRGGTDLVF